MNGSVSLPLRWTLEEYLILMVINIAKHLAISNYKPLELYRRLRRSGRGVMKTIRVLCLHGFTSNSQAHAHQMRRITRSLPEIEFVFADGPHTVDIAKEMDLSLPANRAWADHVRLSSNLGSRAWWVAHENKWENPSTGGYYGLEESLRQIDGLLRATGSIDAVWGFSQGACLASILCALSQASMADHALRKHLSWDLMMPQKGIFFSGFRSRLALYDSLYETGIRIPTLHVTSGKDAVVTTKWSEALQRACTNASVLRHGDGHHIPKSDSDCSGIVDFMRNASTS